MAGERKYNMDSFLRQKLCQAERYTKQNSLSRAETKAERNDTISAASHGQKLRKNERYMNRQFLTGRNLTMVNDAH